MVGINGARGGLSTPLLLPTSTCPPTRTAPVLPDEIKASASCFLTIFKPTTIDESFFLRIAKTGGSAVSITWDALTTWIWFFGYPEYFASSLSITSCFPVRITFMSCLSVTASTAALTGSAGALSPPIASTTTLTCSAISSYLLFTYCSLTDVRIKRYFLSLTRHPQIASLQSNSCNLP